MNNKLSVVIITFNEEKNIWRCLDSVKEIADEIIVLDSYSQDNTVDIAKTFGATVRQQPFKGYIETKNDALLLASNAYVLCLDGDEALSDELSLSIKNVKNHFSFSGYTMNRCTNYCGKFIRHGLWYPDRKLRLFDHHLAKWGGTNPHDKVEFLHASKPGYLKGDILHFSYNYLDEHPAQNNRFSSIAAQAKFEQGKRTNFFKLFINPLWAFINGYLFRLGFLDGFYGFVIAVNISHFTFMKHYKLYALQNGNKQ